MKGIDGARDVIARDLTTFIKLSNLIFIALAMLLLCSTAHAQLSPGPLSTAHSNLEGLSNCTKCHTLGDKVENAKCLDCHSEISTRMDNSRGFHAAPEVQGQDCFKCHSEHHGRTFDMVRFDIERFDHKKTGYTLTGAHKTLECVECHQARFIKDPELRKRKDTYLGLDNACVLCHTDFHQGTLGNTCTQCHTTEAFVPASEFLHAETEFPLRGAHQNVDCASCHQVSTRNGSSFQEFAGVAFTNCSSCHDDPHSGRFGVNCKECHVEESFHLFRGMESFNHNKTGFPLTGQHRKISCAECHDTKTSTAQMFKDFVGKDVSNCIACHEDVHETRFGNDCRACHSEESFRTVIDFTAEDHLLTAFPLRGKHETVDCRKCHESRMTEPLVFNACAACHEDYHEGQFVSASHKPDCASCHTVDGFASSTFTIEQHNQTAFALTGAHLATPCFACHIQDEQWMFRNIGSECIDCHQDPHAASIEAKYYPDNACTNCHETESWKTIEFDHEVTGFLLEGEHTRQSCTACHIPDIDDVSALRHIVFNEVTPECAGCHENIHQDQFEIDGITDCRRCHSPEHWSPSSFDHNTARFALEGAHLSLECNACHKETDIDGESVVQYRIGSYACIDCHQ